jgi:hypothetical protein
VLPFNACVVTLLVVNKLKLLLVEVLIELDAYVVIPFVIESKVIVMFDCAADNDSVPFDAAKDALTKDVILKELLAETIVSFKL